MSAQDCNSSEVGLDELESLRKEAREYGLDNFLERLLLSSRKQVSDETSEVEKEIEKLGAQLEDLVFQNYRDLLENYEHSVSSSATLRSLQDALDRLSRSFPLFVDKCVASLSVLNQSLQESRGRLSDGLDHFSVKDLLELPTLIVSLIRAGEIESSVELIDHFRRLNLLVSGSRIFEEVCDRVRNTRLLVLSYILQRLSSKLSFNECLYLMTLLRRTCSLDDVVLRILFLCCRSHWMLSSLKGLCSPKSQNLFSQFNDEFRIRILETNTQYYAVFPGTESRDYIYDDFVTLWISFYLQVTQKYLCNVTDGASMSSLIQQANYCGQSLSRIGADFRLLLCTPFEEASVLLFSKSLEEALLAFETMLESFQWYPSASSFKVNESTRQNDSSSITLPYQLLEFPPLSVLFNGILVALNELRQVVFISRRSTYVQLFQNTLQEAAAVIKDFGGIGGSLLPQSQRDHFRQLCKYFLEHLIPKAIECLQLCLQTNVDVETDSLRSSLETDMSDC